MLEFKAEYDELKIEMKQYSKDCKDLKDDTAISALQESARSSQDAALGQKCSRAEATVR